MSTAVKIKRYKTMVKTSVVFGSEMWAVAEMDMNKLGTGERRILSRIYGLVVEQGIWRIRTNQELRKVYKNLDIVADITKKRLD